MDTSKGAIDIVCNLFTDQEVALRGSSVDAQFLSKLRVDPGTQKGVTVDGLIERMDRAGIEMALIPATRAGDQRMRFSWRLPYERVAEVVEQHPSRFRGLAGVDPTAGMQGLSELERGVREMGFVGAHLYPHWFGLAPDHARYYPIYAKCCELGIPIMMQVGQCQRYGEEITFPSVGRPITLDQVAIDFPELTIIGIHIGVPWTDEMISMAYKHRNVYIGTDAYAPKYWPRALVHYANSWGQGKVIFGTDFPVIDPERAMREIADLALKPDARALLLRGAAERIFRLDPA